MKKYILIVTLILINTLFYLNGFINKKINKVSIDLDKDELGVILFNTKFSNFIVFNLNNNNTLFLIDCNDIKQLEDYIDTLKINFNYVIMNKNYSTKIAYNTHKKVLNGLLTLNNIHFSNEKILYNDKGLCINIDSKCDYIYEIGHENNKLFIYNNDKIKDEYIVESNSYITFKIK